MEIRRAYERLTLFSTIRIPILVIESMKTTSLETVSTGVLDKNKEHYLRSKGKAEKSYDVLRYIKLHMSKYEKNMKIYNPLCQTYSPTVV